MLYFAPLSANYTCSAQEKRCFNWFTCGASPEYAISDIHFEHQCAIATIFVLYYLLSPVCEIQSIGGTFELVWYHTLKHER